MKKSKFFVRTLILLFAIIVPIACGSDDNGENPVADVEALYAVNTAKEVKDYTSGESLATVSDADGTITKATLNSGSNLPAGTTLNSTTGELTVSDVASLTPGTYSIGITTEDTKGGTTEHTITVIFNDNSDTASLYTVTEAKAVTDYTMGESIATVTDADGDIVSAALESGSELPAGTALNATTGEIVVEDASLLTPGSYDINITTEDAQGGTTVNTIAITFNENPDVDAVYTVVDAKAVKDYVVNESIATVTDDDGEVTSAVLGSGSDLPAGTTLNATTGEITVVDPMLLVPGTYDVEITTQDAQGGTTVNMVAITFNENPDVDAVYTVADAKAVEDYEANESIATVTDDNGDITSAVLGSGSNLPAGTALNATTGEITVTDPALLIPGTYDFEITTEDSNAGTTTQAVTLVFNENPIRVNINSGGDELVFADITFSADQLFVGTSTPFTPDPIPAIENTDKDELYVTERYGADFGYAIDLENGTYRVTLHFAELFWGAPGLGSAGGTGDRIFDVSLEGVVVMDDYDIFEDVGALFATEKEFEVTLNDGILNIGFISSADNAKLSALEVVKIN